jgi:hypothetical protein
MAKMLLRGWSLLTLAFQPNDKKRYGPYIFLLRPITVRRRSSEAGVLVAIVHGRGDREVAESSFSRFWDLILDHQIRTEEKEKSSKSLRSGRLFQTKGLTLPRSSLLRCFESTSSNCANWTCLNPADSLTVRSRWPKRSESFKESLASDNKREADQIETLQ